MAVSQRHIAEKLGVSIALVSRVLSGKAAEIGIAPETIERVLQAADEMGYVPSAAALSLIGKSTRTIGIAVYDFNDPFFGTLIREIQTQAHDHDYTLVLAGFLNRQPDRQDLLGLNKYSLDGLIVIGTDLDARWIESFAHLPIARIGHGGSKEPSVRITIDEAAAASLLVDHMLEQGCRNLVYLGASLPAHKIRAQAMSKAAEDRKIRLHCMLSTSSSSFQSGLDLTREVIATQNLPDGLVCATDQVAMGSLNALAMTSNTNPERVAVTGFDDIPAAAQFIPPITTLRQPLRAMVGAAFTGITENKAPSLQSFAGTLIQRQST